jgi:S-adenosylmethionine:tRNA ribosyltransferase-isomerase
MEETLPQDAKRYQTDFSRQSGAVAAPTAGLHFSQSLLENLRSRGIEIEFIHLSVGWGTFQPLTEEHWKSGRLHAEWVEISESASQRILKQKSKGKRVIAVGTTVVRALEWWHPRKTLKGWCDLFLRPPWKSEIVDAMVTNFHLPGSSLLVLVGSFIDPEKGRDRLLKLYEEAVQAEYRFYSYGDAMLIL